MDNTKVKTNIYTAMLQAQLAFDKIVRTDEAFNYKYAPLDKIIDATRKALSDNGLVIMQFPINVEDRVGVRTVLAYKDGETIASEYTTTSYKKDPQGIGSLITYLRRYAYMAVCGIAPEDDDGASAMPTEQPRQYTPRTQNTGSGEQINAYPATPKQVSFLLKNHIDASSMTSKEASAKISEIISKSTSAPVRVASEPEQEEVIDVNDIPF